MEESVSSASPAPSLPDLQADAIDNIPVTCLKEQQEEATEFDPPDLSETICINYEESQSEVYDDASCPVMDDIQLTSTGVDTELSVGTAGIPEPPPEEIPDEFPAHSEDNECFETDTGEKIFLDGQSELNDLVLASCFAKRDNDLLLLLQNDSTFYEEKKSELTNLAQEKEITEETEASVDEAQFDSSSSDTTEDDSIERKFLEGAFDDDDELLDDSTQLPDQADPNADGYGGLKPYEPETVIESYPEEAELTAIGTISSIVDKLIVIAAVKGMKPLDVGSVLAKENHEIIGAISDTFGPVASPYYAICVSDPSLTSTLEIGSSVYTDFSSSTFLVDENEAPVDFLLGKFDCELSPSPDSEYEFKDCFDDQGNPIEPLKKMSPKNGKMKIPKMKIEKDGTVKAKFHPAMAKRQANKLKKGGLATDRRLSKPQFKAMNQPKSHRPPNRKFQNTIPMTPMNIYQTYVPNRGRYTNYNKSHRPRYVNYNQNSAANMSNYRFIAPPPPPVQQDDHRSTAYAPIYYNYTVGTDQYQHSAPDQTGHIAQMNLPIPPMYIQGQQNSAGNIPYTTDYYQYQSRTPNYDFQQRQPQWVQNYTASQSKYNYQGYDNTQMLQNCVYTAYDPNAVMPKAPNSTLSYEFYPQTYDQYTPATSESHNLLRDPYSQT